MTTVARDVMTTNPVCCTTSTTLDQVARMMAQNNCGEIPVIDIAEHPVGVITDRDIVCRVVADGKNPTAYTTEKYMSQPAITVSEDTPIGEVIETMEANQIRRVPVVDGDGCCTGMIAQADIALKGGTRQVAELVREVSRD